MSQHIIILLLLAVTIYFVHTYDTDLEELMRPSLSNISESVGIHDVKFSTNRYDPFKEIVNGSITILYFHSNSCPACRILMKDLNKFLRVRPDVVIKKFDLGDDWSVDDAYNTYTLRISMVPFIYIYGSDGKLIAKDNENERHGYELLYKWMKAELRK